MIIIIMLIFMVIVKRLLRPIGEIMKSIKKGKVGVYKSDIKMEGKHEIWQMVNEFNEMFDSINSMNHKMEDQNKERVIALKKQRMKH